MAAYTITQHGLEIELNDIAFQPARSRKDAMETCLMYWGRVSGSVLVTVDDRMFVCDGVDPTTGQVFTPEVEAILRDTVDVYEILY